jgi:Zn finger protein HypA/HybF involved in hydrogenase expression
MEILKTGSIRIDTIVERCVKLEKGAAWLILKLEDIPCPKCKDELVADDPEVEVDRQFIRFVCEGCDYELGATFVKGVLVDFGIIPDDSEEDDEEDDIVECPHCHMSFSLTEGIIEPEELSYSKEGTIDVEGVNLDTDTRETRTFRVSPFQLRRFMSGDCDLTVNFPELSEEDRQFILHSDSCRTPKSWWDSLKAKLDKHS